MKYILFIVFIYVCLSCINTNHTGNDNGIDSDILVLDFDKASVKDTLHASSFVAKVTPIVLETTNNNLIGCLSNMQVTDDCICVLDVGFSVSESCGLFVFDKKGKYLRNIGRRGQGPGEFTGLRDFTIDEKNDKIFLMDDKSNKILVYKFSTGEFLSKIEFGGGMVKYGNIQYNDGELFVDFTYFSQSAKGSMVYALNEITGKIDSEYLDVDIHNHGWLKPFYKTESYFYCKNSEYPKYTHFFMDTIMIIKNKLLSPYLVIKSKDWVVKNDLIMNENHTDNVEEDALFKIEKLPISFRVQNYVESDDYIYFVYSKQEKFVTVIYDKKNQILSRTKSLLDDIMFGEWKKSIRQIFCGDANGMYGCVNTIEMPNYYKNVIENKSSTLKPEYRTIFEKEVTSESNPVILYYEYRK